MVRRRRIKPKESKRPILDGEIVLYLPSFVLIFSVIRWRDGNDGDEEDDVGD